MGTPRNAAVYARISSDQDGTGLGVDRQVKDCRRLAGELGWEVAEEYVDNDISAYSGKTRPAYERMLADLAGGHRDGVMVYHADRLTRRPIELEQFVEVVTAAGVADVRFVAGGPVDVGNGDGLMVLRLLAAVAANESAAKSRRVSRKMVEIAAAGRPHGGLRPFGFEADRVTIRESEAVVIRAVVERFLAGESVRSLTIWLEDQGIPTVKGKRWRITSLSGLLKAPRIAGLRSHRGEVVGKAVWDPIITPEQHDRILALYAQRATRGRRSPRRYLLSGMLRCGKCGNKLYSSPRATTRRYVCLSGTDHGGCGRLTIVAEPVEELIAQAVLYRLDTPELADALAGRAAADSQAAELSQTLGEDRAQLEELAGLYAAKQVTAREWLSARGPIEARIADTERRLSRMTRSDALAGLIGNGQALKSSWAELNLTRQAAIVAAVLDHAVIAPGSPRAVSVDPGRVEPIWRL